MSLNRVTHVFKEGFTLIEVVLVIVLITILSTVSYTAYSNLNRHEALDKDTTRVLAVFEDARTLSLGSKNGSEYGVRAESDKVIRFSGSLYSPGASTNLEEVLTAGVEISDISLSGGGTDVVFSRIGGTTTRSGTITLSLTSDPARTRTITIYSTGFVEITN